MAKSTGRWARMKKRAAISHPNSFGYLQSTGVATCQTKGPAVQVTCAHECRSPHKERTHHSLLFISPPSPSHSLECPTQNMGLFPGRAKEQNLHEKQTQSCVLVVHKLSASNRPPLRREGATSALGSRGLRVPGHRGFPSSR